jgi:SDR family mycofactocin-dependent oxidoreductase
MGRVENKVAFITGAARGQGRSHAVMLASEGASIAAVDIGDQKLPGRLSRTATEADLRETVRLVEERDRRCVGLVADISQESQVKKAVDATLEEFGRIDVVVANAAVFDLPGTPLWEIDKENWDALIAVNLTGTWLTLKHVAPHMVAQGSGSIILVSSAAGLQGMGYMSSYTASKYGVRGLMKAAANEFGHSGIRVNSIHPGSVDTPAIDAILEMAGTSRDNNMFATFTTRQIFPNMLQPEDVSYAVLYLASDESRNVTGLEMAVDAGMTSKTGR